MKLPLILICVVVMSAVTVAGRIWFEGDMVPGTNYTVGNQDPPDWQSVALPAEELGPWKMGAPAWPDSQGLVSRGLGRLALRLQALLPIGTVFSPLSVALAFALVLLGAKGRTYVEIATALGLSNDTDPAVVEELHQVFGGLFKSLEGMEGGVQLELASGVFVQRHFPIKTEYSTTVRDLYKGTVLSLDFAEQPQIAADTINKWVDKRTEGHIPNILSEPLGVDTRVVIVNAVYFHGPWQTPFNPQFTKKQKFERLGGEPVEVDMMVNMGEAYYWGNPDVKVLGLPYKGGEHTMFFLLPQRLQLSAYLASLTPLDLQYAVHNATLTQTIYAVPRLRLEASLNLQSALEGLGVESLWRADKADLGGLAEGVYVNSVVQKVELLLTESGTTASAATVIDLVRTGGPLVRLDRPFLLFLYHHPTRLVSFWATVYDPTLHSF